MTEDTLRTGRTLIMDAIIIDDRDGRPVQRLRHFLFFYLNEFNKEKDITQNSKEIQMTKEKQFQVG